MEKPCYECGNTELEKEIVALNQESQLTLFAQTAAEVGVCKKCGTVITIKREHPAY